MSDPGPDLLIANLFHAGDANLIIMTGQEISVNIPPSLDPVYSNMIQIAYKDDEFTFMFLWLRKIGGRAKAIVSITAHAKTFSVWQRRSLIIVKIRCLTPKARSARKLPHDGYS
jgi:hypothetical protein